MFENVVGREREMKGGVGEGDRGEGGKFLCIREDTRVFLLQRV